MKGVHPVNRLVSCDSGGIWGGDDLPVLSWEASDRRVVLPESLAREVPIDRPVVRWSAEKIDALLVKRPDVLVVLERLSYELTSWLVVGMETRTGNWRVMFEGSDGRYYAVSIRVDSQGSWNAITIVGSSNPAFWRNRLKGLSDPKVRS